MIYIYITLWYTFKKNLAYEKCKTVTLEVWGDISKFFQDIVDVVPRDFATYFDFKYIHVRKLLLHYLPVILPDV